MKTVSIKEATVVNTEKKAEEPSKSESQKEVETSVKTEEQIEFKEDPPPSIHTCPVCKKSFSQRNKFAQHLALHVTPEPDTPHLWPCPVCPKKLRSCDGLARHQETHLESRNFCCHVCGRLFQTLTCLLNHVRVQHSPESGPGARPRHTCPICNRVFRQSTHMVQHLRTHTGTTYVLLYFLLIYSLYFSLLTGVYSRYILV